MAEELMTDADKRTRLELEPDFILMKRFGYSLARLLERYPDGATDEIAAQALGISKGEVDRRYQKVVDSLQKTVGAG